MPPRKSNVSAAGSNGAEGSPEATPAKAAKEGTSVEELSLPKSMVARLAKGVLPANTQIHKDALLALHKSATVFVSYIASTSNENAQAGGKKTISPQDVMAAMKDCEFEDFMPRLEAELKTNEWVEYNETQCDKRNTYRRKVKEEKAAAVANPDDQLSKEVDPGDVANGTLNGHVEDDDEDRPVKKFKVEDGSAVNVDPDGMEDDEMNGAQDGEPEEAEDQPDEDDDDEDEEEIDDEDDDDDDDDEDHPDGPVVLLDPEYHAGSGDIRDEALDDPEGDSD